MTFRSRYAFLPTALLTAFLMASPAKAASCYEPEEVEAESALRLHSELMVTAITCLRGPKGEDLIRTYTGFTRNNLKKIQKWEKVMLDHYRSQGGGVADLDKLRTALANDIAQLIAKGTSPAAYCASNASRVVTSLGWGEADLNKEIGLLGRASALHMPKCSQQATAQAEPKPGQ